MPFSNVKILFFSVVSLVLGLLTYFIFNDKILLFKIFNWKTQTLNNSFISSFLSDLFYISSITFISHYLFRKQVPSIYLVFLIITPTIFEISQFFCINLGVFDVFDLLLLITYPLIYYFIFIPYEK
jgi:hypothetical protein